MGTGSNDLDLPREKAKKGKSRVDTRVRFGRVRSTDLTSTTKTSERVKHAGAQETDESQHRHLGDGVVVVSPPSRRTVKDLCTLRTGVLAAGAAKFFDFCLYIRHGG